MQVLVKAFFTDTLLFFCAFIIIFKIACILLIAEATARCKTAVLPFAVVSETMWKTSTEARIKYKRRRKLHEVTKEDYV